MTPDRRCRATNADGTRCAAPEEFVNPSGYCYSHDPDPDVRKAHRASASRGGKATARKSRGLTADELPPLTSYEAAEIWTDRIGRAAALGTISSSAANAALRAVKEWREARDGGKVSEKLDALEKAMRAWRETGDPKPVQDLLDKWRRGGLRVVDGDGR